MLYIASKLQLQFYLSRLSSRSLSCSVPLSSFPQFAVFPLAPRRLFICIPFLILLPLFLASRFPILACPFHWLRLVLFPLSSRLRSSPEVSHAMPSRLVGRWGQTYRGGS